MPEPDVGELAGFVGAQQRLTAPLRRGTQQRGGPGEAFHPRGELRRNWRESSGGL